MKFFLSSLLLLSSLSCISFSTHSFELVPHSATYSANIKKGIKIKGKAVRHLKKMDENRWHYSFNVRSFVADINESTQFTFEDGRLLPQSYNYKLSPMFGRDRKAKVHFDWQADMVNGRSKGADWEITGIPSNTYDRLSYQLQLLRELDSPSPRLDFQIAHKKKLRPSTFVKTGEELITTKLGEAKALVVKKVRADDSKRQTHLWVSEKYPMLLLKMTQIEKDGEEYEIHLETANVNGTEVTFK